MTHQLNKGNKMELKTAYVGRGKYKVFHGNALVGVIQELAKAHTTYYCPRAFTASGEKCTEPQVCLAVAVNYIERKLIKHGERNA